MSAVLADNAPRGAIVVAVIGLIAIVVVCIALLRLRNRDRRR